MNADERMIRQDRPIREHQGGSRVWPYVLIGLGLILLLENIGVRTNSFWWALGMWWPLVLIAIGADLLLRPYSWGRMASVVLGLATLLTIGIWTFARPAAIGMQSETINVPRSNASRAEIQLGIGIGRLELGAGSGGLVMGTLEIRAQERLERDVRQSGGTDFVRLEAHQTGMSMSLGSAISPRWNLQLAQGVPITLRVNTGVGESRLNLTDLSITALELKSGVGETTVDLPKAGQPNIRIESGVGETTIRIPSGMVARIKATNGIGGVQVNGSYTRDGDTYTANGFETASNRAELEVKGGIGRVVIESNR